MARYVRKGNRISEDHAEKAESKIVASRRNEAVVVVLSIPQKIVREDLSSFEGFDATTNTSRAIFNRRREKTNCN